MTVDMEVICVGNELLIGKIQNTNAQWLSKQATQLGVNVKRVTVVQDIVAEIADSICEARAKTHGEASKSHAATFWFNRREWWKSQR